MTNRRSDLARHLLVLLLLGSSAPALAVECDILDAFRNLHGALTLDNYAVSASPQGSTRIDSQKLPSGECEASIMMLTMPPELTSMVGDAQTQRRLDLTASAASYTGELHVFAPDINNSAAARAFTFQEIEFRGNDYMGAPARLEFTLSSTSLNPQLPTTWALNATLFYSLPAYGSLEYPLIQSDRAFGNSGWLSDDQGYTVKVEFTPATGANPAKLKVTQTPFGGVARSTSINLPAGMRPSIRRQGILYQLNVPVQLTFSISNRGAGI
jgi:hypothetical protein